MSQLARTASILLSGTTWSQPSSHASPASAPFAVWFRQPTPRMARRPVQTLWLGPGRHFVHYPISRGQLVNLVAIAPAGNWRTESWTDDGEISDLLREFETWDGRLRQIIVSATETKRWALYDREPLERWTKGRITLLGDAAHAMLPFLAQGAAQATEDAAALADRLEAADERSV